MVPMKFRKRHFYIFTAVSFVLLFCIYFFDIKKVSGVSMSPLLRSGEKVLVFKAAYGIKSPFENKYLIRWKKPVLNDIVMFKIRGRCVVKRCYAAAGTVLKFSSAEGSGGSRKYSMTVNGKVFSLTPNEFRNLGGMSEESGEYAVPENMLLLLGDNQEASEDSKNYGFVSADSICGKVLRKF